MPSLFVIDVGHGNCAVIKDGERIIIVDTGRGSNLLDFLIKNQFCDIDLIILSHADQDHIAGLTSLLTNETINISKVYLNSDSTKNTKIWDDLLYSLQDHYIRNQLGFSIGITPDIETQINTGRLCFQIIAPGPYLAGKGPGSAHRHFGKITSNSISAVIRIKQNDQNLVLLPGDLDWIGLLDILADRKQEMEALLTVYPHHGGRPGGSDTKRFANNFCTAVKPEYIVFSAESGSSEFPNLDTITEIIQNYPDCLLYCTGHSTQLEQCRLDMKITSIQNGIGSIKVDLNDNNLSIEIIK